MQHLQEYSMDYENLYVNLLVKHGSETRPLIGYVERHHIIPKWMGGSDDKENLVYLSARVHFIAHWMLYKIYRDAKSARALYGMCDNRRPERSITSRQYEIGRAAFAANNHMKLPVYRKLASESASKQWQERYDEMKDSNAAMFEDPDHPMYMKGKVGDSHPRSRAVITPLGRFGSVREAGKAHSISHNIISRRCKDGSNPDYYYEDGLG
jgi:hypothetical protein